MTIPPHFVSTLKFPSFSKAIIVSLSIIASGCGGGATDNSTANPASVELAAVHLIASPTGSSTADCSDDQPCSLTKARDTVRNMNRGMKEDIVVYLRGGVYKLDTTFTLNATDSGMNGYRVVYQAYPGEKPVLSGGVNISGWTMHDAAKNIHRARAPSGLQTRQLFVNGKRAQRARGNMYPSGFTKTNDGYTAPDASMASWRNPADIEIVHNYQWQSFRCGVASISGNAITMKRPCWTIAQAPQQYFIMGLPTWIENAYELLKEPGQWYYDRAAGYIYYMPRAGENMATAEAVVPVLETLMKVAGTADNPVRDITFNGITFAHATWLRPSTNEGYPSGQGGQMLVGNPANYQTAKTPGNVVFNRVQNILLERNMFEHLGAAALAIEAGSKSTKVIGNTFRDISSTAIALGETDQPNTTDAREITKDNVIRNNYITRACQEFYSGVGIFVAYAQNTVIDHNELDNLPYSAISVGWGWGGPDPSVAQNNKITNNRVHRVMQRLADGGMIYTLGAQPNSEIKGNYLAGQVFDFAGIYLDQGSQYFTIGENVIASANYWLLHQNQMSPGARNNTVLNNYTDAPIFFANQGDGFSVSTVSGGAWPVGALNVMGASGLEAGFHNIREASLLVEAEAFDQDGYYEMSPGNAANVYRTDESVDVYPCWTCSNDFSIGHIQSGEYLSYTVYVDKDGVYDFEFNVATVENGARIQLVIDSQPGGQFVDLPNTGGWATYQTASLKGIPLSKGRHVLSTVFTAPTQGFAFDSFTYKAQ